ncbi:MAG: agmatine deiminase family protein [Candidatus Omnitrophica bacterium]|nr:agmatine deiminase family protein [Candidatus Omnitrophota bacterium]
MTEKRRRTENTKFFGLTARGYRMPAEWEPHRGTWLSWPHNPKSFFTALEGAQEGFADMIMHLARVEEVHVNLNDDAAEAKLKRKLKARKVERNVFLHRFPTNDAWCRDHGAIILKHKKSGQLVATDWIFNAWGGKYPSAKDNRIAGKMAGYLGLARFQFPVVLEGGSIDVNGQGLLLTTELCLLNRNRNPQYSRKEIETLLKSNLGVRKILWLKDGIAGDDTDGHIDDLARFTDPRTIVTVVEDDPSDANYSFLKENLELLKSLRDLDGQPFRIVTLPMPEPRYYRKDERLPASYANFYVANGIVLLPTFDCPQDQEAVRILGKLFPGRQIVKIDATDIIVGLGTCHCLTQQIPL